jgi:hypothetical protein
VAEQLNRTKVTRGVFRCQLELKDDGSDWQMVFWIEPAADGRGDQELMPFAQAPETNGKLQTQFLAGGGSMEAWMRAINTPIPDAEVLEEIRALRDTGVFKQKDAERNVDSVRMALKILGRDGMHDPREFVANLLKEQAVGGTKIRNPAATWMSRIKLSVKNRGLSSARAAKR